MSKAILDTVINDLLAITPSIRRSLQRKLVKTAFTHIEEHITLAHIEIMKTLRDEGTLHIAEIGERLQIPKPQMTHLLDRLEQLKIVCRSPEPSDRRIINVALTDKGRRIGEEFDRVIRTGVGEKLASLSDAELKELSVSLHKLYALFSRL
ncbi:MAG: MarR family transcriptional regulator [Dehalococcoidales bacterium]|nr:MarR family transcriptional regulator [Dehalococcoidales bacterium]